MPTGALEPPPEDRAGSSMDNAGRSLRPGRRGVNRGRNRSPRSRVRTISLVGVEHPDGRREVRKPASLVPNDRELWKLATSTSPRPDPDPARSPLRNFSNSRRLAASSFRASSKTSRPGPVGRLRQSRGFGMPSVAPASAAPRHRPQGRGPRSRAASPALLRRVPNFRRQPHPAPPSASPSRCSRPMSAECLRPT